MTDKPILIFTGGHHTGGLAVAQQLKKKGWGIVWIGHRYSMKGDRSETAEYKEVVSSGIPFYELKAGKFYRNLNILNLVRLPYGFIKAYRVINHIQKEYGSSLKGIISFGGYLAVPVVVVGKLVGLKTITHEQTVVAGWANRVIALFAHKIALTWKSSATLYPPGKSIVTGLPLRPQILALKTHGRPSSIPVIYVTGGKQGSHVLNEVVFQALSELLSQYKIIHQTGNNSVYKDYEKARALKRSLPRDLSTRYLVHSYLSSTEIATALKQADVVVGRSGAHITYELAYLGLRCVLIPLPYTSHDEQLKNAQLLAAHNQAIVISQTSFSPETLVSSISKALKLKPEPVNVPKDGLEKFVQLIEDIFYEKKSQ